MGTTQLEKLLEEEGGYLSQRELKIIRSKQVENKHGGQQSIEGTYDVQRRKIKAGWRKERSRPEIE